MANVVELIWTSDTEGFVFSVSGVRYLASFPKPRPESCQAIRDLSLFTVFADPPTGNRGKRITKKWVKRSLEKYRQDDVFDNAFLANIIFYDALMTGQPDVRLKGEALLQRSGKITMNFADKNDNLVPGPHILWNQQLWQVCKLVDDSYETCMVALKPQQNLLGSFERLSIMGQKGNVLSFAIPSRLKYTLPEEKLPLAGKRILIKDNIHLDGIKTSNGNRAFYETYDAKTQTATCIQDLIDKGAVVIGKTKMSSFENWEEPIQYTDYPAPWNPRADRYQSPGSSSSGSASAIAAYEWLDIAIGTDTLGGVTRPAHWCGCFGLRPSIGAISAEGIEPCVNPWDIPGILARDLKDCKEFAKQWLNFDNEKFADAPKSFSSIIWPVDFWAEFHPTEMDMARVFAQQMADELKITLEEISFEKYWSKHAPSGWRKYPLEKFIKETTRAIAYDKYKNTEDFRTQYKERNGGEPYTSKPNEKIWSLGKQTSSEDRFTASQRMDIYKSWFKQHVLTGRNESAIIVLPLDSSGPRYRDDCPDLTDDNSTDDNPNYDHTSDDSSSDESSPNDSPHDESSHDHDSDDDSSHDHSSYVDISNIDTSYMRAPYTGAPNINIFHINNAYINAPYNDSSYINSLYNDRSYCQQKGDHHHKDTQQKDNHHHKDKQQKAEQQKTKEQKAEQQKAKQQKDQQRKAKQEKAKQQKANHRNNNRPKDAHPKDDRPNPRRPHQSGINALTLGPVMEAPVLAVPICQTSYKSRVNQLEELSPFAVALMGPPGTDIRLIRKVMKVMKSLEMPTKVKTGRSMY
ncbi:glutamyl-tRNA(Gln) amidotransferase [Trichoderma harzianum]|uniref:Glutamyl-tRNA(Gln) amidotransferase n=1 Tax=Trichoderma harzianum TaxID=5544 RepID=A0A0F9Y451_TRIHA|nr:glutamyl-tRNA(Gln) amidotransferase [Trichoderma harzianum]